MDASSAALSAALPSTRTVPGSRPALPERPGEVGLVPEYALVPALAEEKDATVLAGTDHTALLRYTWLPTAAALGTPERSAALQDKLLAALKGPVAAEAIGAAHLRRPGGAAPPGSPAGRLPQLTAKPLEPLGAHHVDHVFAAWYVQDRRSSILLAVDISGSMLEPAPGTHTPLIDFVRQGCLAVGRLLPDQSSLGLWAFGSQLDPPRDYQVLLPTAPLTEGQRAGLTSAVGQLVGQRTGTGLYDTILAAYRSATESYRKDVGNQVVIFTDGRNEDDPGSITADQLAAGLKAAADDDRPVEITVVAYGSRPEADVLEKALAPVDGYVSKVQTSEQVAAAFLHAAASGIHFVASGGRPRTPGPRGGGSAWLGAWIGAVAVRVPGSLVASSEGTGRPGSRWSCRGVGSPAAPPPMDRRQRPDWAGQGASRAARRPARKARSVSLVASATASS